MDPTVKIALIVAAPPFLAALAGLITSLRNKAKLDRVSLDVDGRLTELLELTRKASDAEGALRGAAEARAEQAAGRPPLKKKP